MLIVYSKANCHQCTMAKELLNRLEVPFEEVRVDLDSEARSKLLAAGHRSVPQVYDKDHCLVGGLATLLAEPVEFFQQFKDTF